MDFCVDFEQLGLGYFIYGERIIVPRTIVVGQTRFLLLKKLKWLLLFNQISLLQLIVVLSKTSRYVKWRFFINFLLRLFVHLPQHFGFFHSVIFSVREKIFQVLKRHVGSCWLRAGPADLFLILECDELN